MQNCPQSPGELLSLMLSNRGINQKQLAQLIKRPHKTISAIVNDKKRITPETALDFELVFTLPAESWLHVQSKWEVYHARKKYSKKPGKADPKGKIGGPKGSGKIQAAGDQINRWYLRGETIKEIANYFEVSYSGVYKYLKAQGILLDSSTKS